MPNNSFTLEDFITNSQNTGSSLVKSQKNELVTNLSTSITSVDLSLTNSQSKKFEKQIVDYISSPATIKSISDLVGQPKENESEEEFVERSLNRISDFLHKKFD